MKKFVIDVRKRLQEYNKNAAYKKLRDHYASKTIFEIMGKSRNETAHSSFLAWLLEGKDIPSSGNDCPLMGLLDIIIRRASEQGIYNGDERFSRISKAVLSRSIDFENIKAKTEQNVLDLAKDSIREGCKKMLKDVSYVIGGSDKSIDIKELISPKGKRGKKDSTDIYITCDVQGKGLSDITRLEFLIENKVVSLEGKGKSNANEYEEMGQSKRYYWACNKDGVKNVMQFFLFLTASASSDLEKGKKEKNNAWCEEKDHYICINYQDIYDDILEPLITSERLSDKTELIIKEYVRSLSLPVMSSDSDGENDNKLGNRTTIMSTSKSERDSLLSFWNDNQDMLYCVMEVVEEIDNLQPHSWKHCIYENRYYDKRNTIQLVYNLFKKSYEEKENDYQKIFIKEQFNKKLRGFDIFDKKGIIIDSQVQKAFDYINKKGILPGFTSENVGKDFINDAFNYYYNTFSTTIPDLSVFIRDRFNNFKYTTAAFTPKYDIIDGNDCIKNTSDDKIGCIYEAIGNEDELRYIIQDIEEVAYKPDSDTKDLLYSFWEVNQDLVMAALWVLSDSDSITEEDKSNIKKVYSKMAKRE